MPDVTANPIHSGAGDSEATTVSRLGAFIKQERGQPSQPAEPSAPAQANQEQPQPERRQPVQNAAGRDVDPDTKRFVPKEPDPVEKTPAEGKAEAAPDANADDHVELADTLDGLASQLGMEPDELANHLKETIKVNGEERKATLKELRELAQKGDDYSRKTAKLAEDRRQHDAAMQAIQQQREHFEARLNPFVQQLEQIVAGDQQRMLELRNAGDLLGYLELKEQSEQRQKALANAQDELGRMSQQKQHEARIQLEQDVARNEELLLQRIPEWKNTEVGKRGLESVRGYLVEQGVPAEAVRTLYDASSIDIARKAMLYDKFQKESKPQALKALEVKATPKFIQPGPVQAKPDPAKKVHSRNLNQLRRTGSVADAAKALVSGGHIRRP
jgi:hypothetical protein